MVQKKKVDKVDDVLIINSYAGSLVLGAVAADVPIRGSYEDVGFGIEAQKLNFPQLEYVDKHPWPDDDLSKTVVIAHPPCAPFSQLLNDRRKEKKMVGTTADGFECHRQVMEYALGSGCHSLAIESVPGVLKARAEYEKHAKKHGYSLFFIHLNSISFGVPQWRPRVWVIFKKGEHLGVNLEPVYRNLQSIMRTEGTMIAPGCLTNMVNRMKKSGVKPEVLRAIFEGEQGSGALLNLGAKILGVSNEGNFGEVRKRWGLGGNYAAMMPRILDPGLWAPVVLGGAAWLFPGRPLFLEEYCEIMGFPADYQWPKGYHDPRMYLSKGVCPPVATWILQQLMQPFDPNRNYTVWVEDGGEMDLCPKKAEVEIALGKREAGEVRPRRSRGSRTLKELETKRSSAADAASGFLSFLDQKEEKK